MSPQEKKLLKTLNTQETSGIR